MSCIFVQAITLKEKLNIMKNLLNTLSTELQAKLNDFKVSSITVEYNEVNTRSEYDLNSSYIVAIENELIALGHNIEA